MFASRPRQADVETDVGTDIDEHVRFAQVLPDQDRFVLFEGPGLHGLVMDRIARKEFKSIRSDDGFPSAKRGIRVAEINEIVLGRLDHSVDSAKRGKPLFHT
jgi:hypothetical protein